MTFKGPSGDLVATNDKLGISVSESTLGELQEAAREAHQLLLDDIEEDR